MDSRLELVMISMLHDSAEFVQWWLGLRRQKCTGAKHCTEAAGLSALSRQAVGEHSVGGEAVPARDGGAYGRANVGMSNHKHDGKSCPRKS